MVSRLLASPVYTGARIDVRKQVVKENCYEPYISKEQFELLFPGKYIYAEGRAVKKPYTESLAVYCAKCGKRMLLKNGTYSCGCPNVADAVKVEKAVEDTVEKEKKLAKELEAEVKAGAADEAREQEAEKISNKMKRILAEVQESLKNTEEDYSKAG